MKIEIKNDGNLVIEGTLAKIEIWTTGIDETKNIINYLISERDEAVNFLSNVRGTLLMKVKAFIEKDQKNAVKNASEDSV